MNDPLKYAIRIDLVRTNYNSSVVLQDYYQRDVLQKYYPNLYIHLNTCYIHAETTILVIIFWNSTMFQYRPVSPQVKGISSITNLI